MHRDRHVRGQCPRRGRPDQQADLGVLANLELPFHRAGIGNRKLDVDAVVVHVLVFQFRIRQGRLIGDRPMHRLELLVDQPRFDEAREDFERLGLVLRGHRQVRIGPLAEDPQSLELFALDLRVFLGVCEAKLADLNRRHLPRLRAKIRRDLVLDRQAVTVPAGHVRRLESLHALEAQEDILERLVDHMPDVDVAVGERRAVVQDPLGRMRERVISSCSYRCISCHIASRLGSLARAWLPWESWSAGGSASLCSSSWCGVSVLMIFYCRVGIAHHSGGGQCPPYGFTSVNVAEGFSTFES